MKDKMLSVEDISKMSEQQLSELYRQGYTLEGVLQESGCPSCKSAKSISAMSSNVEIPGVETLTGYPGISSCPSIIQKGVSAKVTSTIDPTMPGYGQYIYKLWISANPEETYPATGTTPATSYTFAKDLSTLDPGVRNIRVVVYDQCPTGVQMSASDCSVTVKSCTDLKANMSIA